jgi:hypothetical protein
MRCGTRESDAPGRSSGPVELVRENRRGFADNGLNHGRWSWRDGGLFGDFSVNFRMQQKIFLEWCSSSLETRRGRVHIPRTVRDLGLAAGRRNRILQNLRRTTRIVQRPRICANISVFIADSRCPTIEPWARRNNIRRVDARENSTNYDFETAEPWFFADRHASCVECAICSTFHGGYLHFVVVSTQIDGHGTPIPRKQGNTK